MVVLETLDYNSWKCVQEGVRREFLRWFLPYSLKGLYEADWGVLYNPAPMQILVL